MRIFISRLQKQVCEGRLLRVKKLLTVAFLAGLALLSASAYAQSTLRVSGQVKDDGGRPLANASVVVKGSAKGVACDEAGKFVITAPANGTLVISSVGFTRTEIPVNNRSVISVTLNAIASAGVDVVVVGVGYGSQKKRDLTGSIASVNLEAMREAPNTNMGQYLQGTVPGLNVGLSTYAGGTPPISIRGQNTLAGNQTVLIILDGIQYTGSLSSINPDDIASIDVLKDASSTAVYGAQAANGVMLVTTRKGHFNQKPRISFSSAFSTQRPTAGLRPKNRAEFLQGIKDAYWDKAYTGPDYTTPNPAFNVAGYVDATMRDAGGNLLPNDYNWWNASTKTGTIAENHLSISGGGDRVSYFLSGGFVDQKGFIINDIFKRKSIRASIETKPFTWWKVGLISFGSFVNQDGAEPSIGSIEHWSPLQVPFDSSGKLIPFPTNTLEPNPFTTYYVSDRERHNYYFANIYTEIDFPFLKGLTYRMNFGNNYTADQHYFSSIYGANLTGEAYKSYNNYYDYTFDNILTYKRTFGKHDITATLLYGAIERKDDSSLARATGFDRLNLSYNNLGLGATQFVSSAAWKEALNYQMARVNYKFNDRYLVTATIRRDGFSGFSENYKYGYFPTVALGWIISQESFMRTVKAIDFLKLRTGYGVSGNQTPRYSSIARVSTNPSYVFGDGGTTAFGQQVSALGNPNLKWERTKGLNIGVDFSMFDNRFSGTLDYYRNNTYDLLFSVAIPDITGFSTIQTNLGQLRNTGFEAALTYDIVRQKDFSWSSTLNFWKNTNKIVTLIGIDANHDGREDDLVSSGLFIGKSKNTIYDYQTNGIYQLNETPLPGFFAGTVKIVDQDKSGQITPEGDRVFLGRKEPAYQVSFYNSVTYKGLSLSFFLNSIQGGKDGYLGNNNPMYFRDDNAVRNNDLVQIQYWSPATPNAKYPRNITGSHAKIEPNMWESRSFIRLQDVSLSYNLARFVKKVKFQSLNLYVSGKNLVTWTNWKGWDPEALDANNNPQGLITGGRPVMRTFTVGLNITY